MVVPSLGDFCARTIGVNFINGRNDLVEKVMARRDMKGQVTVAALAERLGITRSNLHKRIRREGIKTTEIPCATGGGVQWLTAVPADYADQVTRFYDEARVNANIVADMARDNDCR